ncbi:MAG: dihydroorotase, partial [Phycisphaerae bacterium]
LQSARTSRKRLNPPPSARTVGIVVSPLDSNSVIIRGGRIIDPARGIDAPGDLTIVNGMLAESAPPGAVPVFDATGLIVCPGLWDIHVHLRDPGQTHKEDLQSGTAAAAAGGFTTVACMPNTSPPIDTPEVVQGVRSRAKIVGSCRVLPIAAITLGRLGKTLTDFAELQQAGAVAFSDDGDGVEADDLMLSAFCKAKKLGAVIIQHCEVKALSAGGVLHAGSTARAMGLPGIDPAAEEAMIERDLGLVAQTGARYHVAHISTARSVGLVRQAKAQGLPVTAEVCPHHLLLTDEQCLDGDPNYKMHPPLRGPQDVSGCLEGLLDGTLDCLVTDHAPHTQAEKAVGFARAPFGIVGLETSLPLLATRLVVEGLLDWTGLLARMSVNSAKVLGLPIPNLAGGAPADICVIDPKVRWTIRSAAFVSRGRNTPFDGRSVSGRAVATWIDGSCRFMHRDYEDRWAERPVTDPSGQALPEG